MREAMEFNFPNVQYIPDTLVGSLATLLAEGILFLQDQNFEPLRKGLGNSGSNRMHLVEHVSGESTLFLRLNTTFGHTRDVRRDTQVFKKGRKIIGNMVEGQPRN